MKKRKKKPGFTNSKNLPKKLIISIGKHEKSGSFGQL
jgi:hypothetical protein